MVAATKRAQLSAAIIQRMNKPQSGTYAGNDIRPNVGQHCVARVRFLRHPASEFTLMFELNDQISLRTVADGLMLPVERCSMIKEIAQRVVGAAIVSFWVIVVTATFGIILTSVTTNIISWGAAGSRHVSESQHAPDLAAARASHRAALMPAPRQNW